MCHHAEMLIVIKLNVVISFTMVTIVMLSVVMLNVVMLTVFYAAWHNNA